MKFSFNKHRIGIDIGQHFLGYSSWINDEEDEDYSFTTPVEDSSAWHLWKTLETEIHKMRENQAESFAHWGNIASTKITTTKRGLRIPLTKDDVEDV